MVVILPVDRYHDWLHAPVERVSEFLQQLREERSLLVGVEVQHGIDMLSDF